MSSRLALAFAVGLVAEAPAAHFWLDSKSSGTAGPSTPMLSPVVGELMTLHVWGRPTVGRQFKDVSLNVVASGGGLDFVDGSYVLHNTADGGADRFEAVIDSGTTPALGSDYTAFELGLGGVADAIRGLNGFTLTDPTPRGPGPVCGDGEVGCEIASDGAPAWLIAEFTVGAIAAGSVDLYLQIGERGVVERTLAAGDYDLDGEVTDADRDVWAAAYGVVADYADGNGDGSIDAADYVVWRDHLNDVAVDGVASDTDVRFGADPMGGDEPWHNAGSDLDLPPGDRETNLLGDDPDAIFVISAPAYAAPEPSALASTVAGFALLINKRRRRPTPIRRLPANQRE